MRVLITGDYGFIGSFVAEMFHLIKGNTLVKMFSIKNYLLN